MRNKTFVRGFRISKEKVEVRKMFFEIRAVHSIAFNQLFFSFLTRASIELGTEKRIHNKIYCEIQSSGFPCVFFLKLCKS